MQAVLATSEMSVRPSVKRVNCQKRKKLCCHSYTTWKNIHHSFLARNFGWNWPC